MDSKTKVIIAVLIIASLLGGWQIKEYLFPSDGVMLVEKDIVFEGVVNGGMVKSACVAGITNSPRILKNYNMADMQDKLYSSISNTSVYYSNTYCLDGKDIEKYMGKIVHVEGDLVLRTVYYSPSVGGGVQSNTGNPNRLGISDTVIIAKKITEVN